MILLFPRLLGGCSVLARLEAAKDLQVLRLKVCVRSNVENVAPALVCFGVQVAHN